MCGITGFVDYGHGSDQDVIRAMVKAVDYRGPDSQGSEVYETATAKVGLGHSRLSIIDTSEAGNQPMSFGHTTVVFNGEIYNFREIQKTLTDLGHTFQSQSDTEVILHAYRQWGVELVHHFIGMFAFAIYDEQERELRIFRDRAGVKPLYYYYHEDLFLFGSELKSMMAHPKFEKVIDEQSVVAYINLGYVPSPQSIFRNTNKLEPGHSLHYSISNREIRITKYWDVTEFYSKPKETISYDEAKDQLKGLLHSAFNYRLVSDVPVGLFLSGGYDSTAVAAILQKDRTEKIKTFTIGFEEGINEAPYAKDTAEYLGTDHTEYICTEQEAQSIIYDLPFYFDEPFADQSAIPTILVSRIARESVKVALSADGGDEIFSGYDFYVRLRNWQDTFNKIPSWLKSAGGYACHLAANLVPSSRIAQKHKLHSVGESLHPNEKIQALNFYHNAISIPHVVKSNLLVNRLQNHPNGLGLNVDQFKNDIEVVMAMDFKHYLQNDILTKVDRSTMSVSLEGREPFLDHRIIQQVAALPFEFKSKGPERKILLKDIVHDYIPKSMMDRPKSGFGVPILGWLRNDLSFLLDEYMSEQGISKSGLFHPDYVKEIIDQFKSGKFYYTPVIWRLLMFQMWFDRWMRP